MITQHRSGLIIEDSAVITNPISLEKCEIPRSHRFIAEDGQAYFMSHLEHHSTTTDGFIQRIDPDKRAWHMQGYDIIHQKLGNIGIAAVRLWEPKYCMGENSDIEFANFGHVEIMSEFRDQGLGIPTYIAAQTALPVRYRLARTNNAKPRAATIWRRLDHTYRMVDHATVVPKSPNGVTTPRVFLKALTAPI